ncbi:NUDIX hydrolase [Colwellia hornerae]|uniref:Phosphatase NudJ n=1 Tax=Colwellia hornerae TaxID=89402 RepID=A0A5C6QFG9_9GAMM|nr:NUDIX hydrolase [Colwellia hornerae]TWX57887.1 NUDIX hydrolase [Colwellia hornerae]TWX67589.1 NUDIX hydrolase [Colwellia hornerae]
MTLTVNTITNDHGEDQFKPNATVAAIIVHQNKFLLVEEIEKGKKVFNQPAGHLEANENLISAIEREVLEETGLTLTPDYVSGIYYFYRPEINLYYLRFCFVIEVNEFLHSSPQDDEIIATHWLTFDEIKAKSVQLRSTLVLECIEDYLSVLKNGKKISLSSLKSNL